MAAGDAVLPGFFGALSPAAAAHLRLRSLNDMARLYQTKTWQLQIPDAWAFRDGPKQHFVTFFKPDGVGLLSVFTTDESVQGRTGTGEDFRGRFPGKTWTTRSSDRIWRTWSLTCRKRQLYVRYTCAAKNAGLEDAEVNGMLQSIEESGAQAA